MKITKVQASQTNVNKYFNCIHTKRVRSNVSYGKVGILCDADHDGQGGIAPLLVCFLSKWPQLFLEGKVCIVKTPRYIFTKNKGKKTEQRIYCYTDDEYESVRDKYKGWELRYIKGLGSLREKENIDVLNDTSKWIEVELDDMKCLDIMFSNDVNARRQIMGI